MMNLGKSLSVSESDKYLLDFLNEEVMIGVYFSLVLCSTTHHGVQLVLGISHRETYSSCLRWGYITSILISRAKFQASANFWF